MKTISYFKWAMLGLAIIGFSHCSKDDDDDNGGGDSNNGIIEYRSTTWNAYHGIRSSNSGGDSSVHTVNLVDVRSFKSSIEVSTTVVTEGMSINDIEFITIFEGDRMILDSELDIRQDLPVGDYRTIKVDFAEDISYWICEFQGGFVEIPVESSGAHYFSDNGLFDLDSLGQMRLASPNERLGTFEIKPGRRTSIVSRLNLISVDWHDNDGSGDWSEGDQISNITVAPGVTTMNDFIVEYH